MTNLTKASLSQATDLTDEEKVKLLTQDEANIDYSQSLGRVDDDFFQTLQRVESPVKDTQTKVTLFLDQKVVDYFKHKGRGYQGRINRILKEYVTHADRDF